MNLTAFLLYARAELRTIGHPYVAEKLERIEDIDLCVWVADAIVRAGKGRYQALPENFYQALGDYLIARRHEKASLRAAIERLAVHFEGFLRTAVEAVFPEADVKLVDQEGRSKGNLSQSGYVPDFLKHLLRMNANLWNSKPSYWKDRSVEEAIYGICFRHQQRAKHEARDYSLAELESLATQVLGGIVLFARWATRNSQIEPQVRERRDFASNVAFCIGQKFFSISSQNCGLVLKTGTCAKSWKS
jgi:hypothetical protein